jgi:hypothetical protein
MRGAGAPADPVGVTSPERAPGTGVSVDPAEQQAWFRMLRAREDVSMGAKVFGGAVLENIHRGGARSRTPDFAGYAWKAQVTYAKELGTHERRVREFQTELERHGFIGVRRRQRKTSLLWLTWPTEEVSQSADAPQTLTGAHAPVRTADAAPRKSMLERRNSGGLTGEQAPTTLRRPIESLRSRQPTFANWPSPKEDSLSFKGQALPPTALKTCSSWDRCEPTAGDHLTSFGGAAKSLRNQIRAVVASRELDQLARTSMAARFNVIERQLLRRHVDARRRELGAGGVDGRLARAPAAMPGTEATAADANAPLEWGAGGVDLFALLDETMLRLEDAQSTDHCSSHIVHPLPEGQSLAPLPRGDSDDAT